MMTAAAVLIFRVSIKAPLGRCDFSKEISYIVRGTFAPGTLASDIPEGATFGYSSFTAL